MDQTIHVIHLSHRRDRAKLLRREVRNHPVRVRLWSGVQVKGLAFRGIAQAHKRIVRWAKDAGLPEVCIAEDDLHILGKGALGYFISRKPAEYDLYLASVYQMGPVQDAVLERFTGMTLYFIHSRYYDTFLDTPEIDHIDREMSNWSTKTKTFTPKGLFTVCMPFTVIQHGGRSDNKGKVVDYTKFMRNKPLWKRSKRLRLCGYSTNSLRARARRSSSSA